MKIHRLQFSIVIKSDSKNIWATLWDHNSYKKWAAIFYKGSYVNADKWEEGCKVYFLAPDKSGIYSIIEKHIPNNIIEFKHIGSILNGKEQAIDKETKKWSGSTEIYALTKEKKGIKLAIEIDVLDAHLEFMSKKLPLALKKIKSLSER